MPSQCWDSRHGPPCLALFLGFMVCLFFCFVFWDRVSLLTMLVWNSQFSARCPWTRDNFGLHLSKFWYYYYIPEQSHVISTVIFTWVFFSLWNFIHLWKLRFLTISSFWILDSHGWRWFPVSCEDNKIMFSGKLKLYLSKRHFNFIKENSPLAWAVTMCQSSMQYGHSVYVSINFTSWLPYCFSDYRPHSKSTKCPW